MKNDFRLKDEDLIKDEHYPIKVLFNMVSDERFMETIEYISKEHGFGENYGVCVFPDDLDEYDIELYSKPEGIEFGLHNGDEIVVSFEILYKYLRIICDKYVTDYPQNKDKIEMYLEEYKNNFI